MIKQFFAWLIRNTCSTITINYLNICLKDVNLFDKYNIVRNCGNSATAFYYVGKDRWFTWWL